MEKNNKDIIRYLLDEDFLNYVFDESKELAEYWESFLEKNPSKKNNFLKAKNILLHLDEPSKAFSDEDVDILKKRINISIKG